MLALAPDNEYILVFRIVFVSRVFQFPTPPKTRTEPHTEKQKYTEGKGETQYPFDKNCIKNILFYRSLHLNFAANGSLRKTIAHLVFHFFFKIYGKHKRVNSKRTMNLSQVVLVFCVFMIDKG